VQKGTVQKDTVQKGTMQEGTVQKGTVQDVAFTCCGVGEAEAFAAAKAELGVGVYDSMAIEKYGREGKASRTESRSARFIASAPSPLTTSRQGGRAFCAGN